MFVSVRANSSRLLFVNVRCKVIFLLAVNLVNQSLRIYVDDDQSWYKNRTFLGNWEKDGYFLRDSKVVLVIFIFF